MQQNMSLFNFEGLQVRVGVDANGTPWFVAKDIAEVLEMHWNGSVVSHVPERWKTMRSVSTVSGNKDTLVLFEQGLNFFVMRSDKPNALPFQEWIAGEVLPSIRKTGSYSKAATPPQVVALVLPPDAETQAAIVLKASAFLQQLVPNMRAEMVGACTLRALTAAGLLHKAAGEELRNALSVEWDKAPMFTPTQIGQKLGGVKAVVVNKMLANAGLQVKVGKQWEPTETGKAYSGAVSFQSEHSDHKGIQLKWTAEVVEVLQYAREQHVPEDSKLLV